MKIDVICPNCNGIALSKIRKVTLPGVIITCLTCKAELSIKSKVSAKNMIPGIFGLIVFSMCSYEEPLKYFGIVIVLLAGAWHLSSEPLIIKNIGPNSRAKS